MRAKTKGKPTNVEFLAHLMNFSRNGALMQMLVITALEKYAERVVKAPPMEHGLIDGEAWKRTAQEALDALKENYGPSS